MSTKNGHIVAFWVRKVRALERMNGRSPSAGEVARYVAQSRSTAKKYLDMAVQEGWLQTFEKMHVNNQPATVYATNKVAE